MHGRRAAVGENGALAAREHRGHPPALSAEQPLGHERVDAAVDTVKARDLGSALDGAGRVPESPRLGEGEHRVLALREPDQRGLATEATVFVGFVTSLRHTSDGARENVRRGTRGVPTVWRSSL